MILRVFPGAKLSGGFAYLVNLCTFFNAFCCW